MEHDFWRDVWNEETQRFNQSQPNQFLVKHWASLNPKPKDLAFIPLCGKTIDMMWLKQQGFQVLGAELVESAVQSFFKENDLTVKSETTEFFTKYQSDDITLYAGDIFDLTKQDMLGVKHVFDRASIVALSPELRQRYAALLINILPKGCQILSVVFERPDNDLSGPPFTVTETELNELFGERFKIEFLQKLVPTDSDNFKATRCVYKLVDH